MKMSKSGQRHSDNTRSVGNCTESRCFAALVVRVDRVAAHSPVRIDTTNLRGLMALREASRLKEGRSREHPN